MKADGGETGLWIYAEQVTGEGDENSDGDAANRPDPDPLGIREGNKQSKANLAEILTVELVALEFDLPVGNL